MRRGLVMVSLLAQGQAGNIDTSLNDLRTALKNGSTLHRILDDLERAVRQFEDLNIAQAEVLLGQISDAAEKLGQCPLPRELQKRIKDVQKKKSAGNELKHWSGYIHQLQNWIQIVGDIATLWKAMKMPVKANGGSAGSNRRNSPLKKSSPKKLKPANRGFPILLRTSQTPC